jgi:hypothetical protein
MAIIRMYFCEPVNTVVLRCEGEKATQALPALPSASTISSVDSQNLTEVREKSLKKPQKNSYWSETQDQLLIEVAQRLHFNWKRISRYFPDKHKSAIRRRWENRFDPGRKQTIWTEEEDEIIKALVAQKGPKWKEIAKSLSGRPPDMIKNRYYGHIKRKQDIKDRKDLEAANAGLPDWEELLAEPIKQLSVHTGSCADKRKKRKLQSEPTDSSRSSNNAS